MPVDDNAPLFPIEVAVEPKSPADQARLTAALATMMAGDPSFAISTDFESGQVRLHGRDEFHLDGIVGVLLEAHDVAIHIGAPRVAYRETIRRAAEIDHTFKRLTEGAGQFAMVTIRFEPGWNDTGFVFNSTVTNESVPADFIAAVEMALEAARQNGLIAGFPVTDFKATLQGGAYQEIDSTAEAFKTAARRAFKDLREKGAPVILEPIMRVEVTTPDAFMGDVVGDLNSRRGQIQGTEDAGADVRVTALVPLANMFGYAATLRAFTGARAEFGMQFDHYAPTPVGAGWDDDPTFRPAMGMRA